MVNMMIMFSVEISLIITNQSAYRNQDQRSIIEIELRLTEHQLDRTSHTKHRKCRRP